MPPKKKTTTPTNIEADEMENKSQETILDADNDVITPEIVTPLEGSVDDSEQTPSEDGDLDAEGKENKIAKYYAAVGRRKEATAQVRLYTKKSTDLQTDENKAIIVVNDKPYDGYFQLVRLQNVVESPLKKIKSLNRFKATVLVSGGGIAGQADAIKFGLSRALVLFDPNFAKKLRRAGFLSRDARVKERRKYGLKKARKRGQWSKR